MTQHYTKTRAAGRHALCLYWLPSVSAGYPLSAGLSASLPAPHYFWVRGCVMMDQGRGLDTIMRGIANADSQGSSCCGCEGTCCDGWWQQPASNWV